MDLGKQIKQMNEGGQFMLGFESWLIDYKFPVSITGVKNNDVTLSFDSLYALFVEELKESDSVRLFHKSGAECAISEGNAKKIDLDNRRLEVTLEKEPQKFVDQRSYFRITGTFPIKYKRIEGSEITRIKDVLSKNPSSKRVFNRKIADMLKKVSSLDLNYSEKELFEDMLNFMDHISNKLDAVLDGSVAETKLPEPIKISISGSGFKFNSEEYFQPGEHLHLVLYLPVDSPLPIEAVGRIVGCEREDHASNYSIRIHFAHINEQDRQEIVQYIFVKEREFLKSKNILRNEDL